MKHRSDSGSRPRRLSRGVSSLRRAVAASVEPLEGRLLFAAGDLDSTFGDPTDPGKARITITQAAVPDRANAVGILPDGRILVVGQSGDPNAATQFGIALLNTNGAPDETFGNKGRVAQTFSGSTAGATAILTGPDNKPALFNGDIVIGGYANTNGAPTLQFAMARYTPAGALDPAWPNGGRLLTNFAEDARLGALLLQPDTGAMIGVGTVGNGTDDQIALVRFNADGSVDTTFGTAGDGTVLSGVAGDAHAAAFLAGGQIAVAGKAADGSAVVAVFDANGAPLGSYVDAKLAGANALAVLPDNTLLLAGPTSTTLRPLDSDFAIVHRGADGTTDTTFGGGDGIATIDITGTGANDEPAGVAITTPDASGNFQIVVAGSTNIQRSSSGAIVGSDFAVARLSSDGQPDTAFGNKGAVAQPFSLFDSEGVRTHAMGNALAVQPDGNIVVAGAVPAATLQPTGGGQRGVVERFGLARFLGSGTDVGTGSISGTFYNDLNRNGQRDPGEPVMAGMTAYFDINDNAQPDPGEPKATSGPDGRYSITGLAAGEYYRIREVRGTLTRTQPAGTFPLGYYDVTLAAGQQADGNDFGNFDPAQPAPSTNQAPVAKNDSATAKQDDSVDVNVLANDSDDNPVKLLTVTVTRQPAHGVAVFNPATRVITYTPAEGYTGDDSFTYRLTDTGNKDSADATVSLTVAPATPPATINAMISGAGPPAVRRRRRQGQGVDHRPDRQQAHPAPVRHRHDRPLRLAGRHARHERHRGPQAREERQAQARRRLESDQDEDRELPRGRARRRVPPAGEGHRPRRHLDRRRGPADDHDRPPLHRPDPDDHRPVQAARHPRRQGHRRDPTGQLGQHPRRRPRHRRPLRLPRPRPGPKRPAHLDGPPEAEGEKRPQPTSTS